MAGRYLTAVKIVNILNTVKIFTILVFLLLWRGVRKFLNTKPAILDRIQEKKCSSAIDCHYSWDVIYNIQCKIYCYTAILD